MSAQSLRARKTACYCSDAYGHFDVTAQRGDPRRRSELVTSERIGPQSPKVSQKLRSDNDDVAANFSTPASRSTYGCFNGVRTRRENKWALRKT